LTTGEQQRSSAAEANGEEANVENGESDQNKISGERPKIEKQSKSSTIGLLG